jgi:CheY-like chemotaxis protein
MAPLILLVDDCTDDASMYAEHLVAAGFRVTTAANGSEAVVLALSVVPDLIVMDLEMPVINGWDTAQLLRGDERTRPIPIIALSGFYDTPAVMRAIGAGCGRFVPKPCSSAELESVVRSMLARDRDKTSVPSPTSKP